jgi:hypothetical protein
VVDPSPYVPVLWLCTVLITARVLGQLIVYFRAPRWLPPMERWQSGLVSYPFLVFSQLLVLILMYWISADFTRGEGFWVEPHPAIGMAAFVWSCLYFVAMVVRFFVARRLLIPIIFHAIVAVFQFAFGLYQVKNF